MLFFKNRVALPNVRKLNRKIKKINKIRTNYLDFCNVIIDDADNFTDVMMKTHDEMIDAIKASIKVEKQFDTVYKKYSDLDSNEFNGDEISEDDDDSDDDDSDDDLFETDDCSCECDECAHVEEVNSVNEDDQENQEDDSEQEDDSKVGSALYTIDGIQMKNFKGDNAKLIFITAGALYNDDCYSDLEIAYTNIGLTEKHIDEFTDRFTRQNIVIDVSHVAASDDDAGDNIKMVEATFPLLVIPHADPCKKVLKDILDNSPIRVISGTHPLSSSSNTNISNWYFCDIDEGTDYKNGDRVLIVNVDINTQNKTVTLRFVSSSEFGLDELNDLIS